MRDRIVHGAWGEGPTKPGDLTQTRTFGLGKPRPPFDWVLDYAGTFEVVKKIDALANDLWQFNLELALAHSAGGFASVGNALKQISRKPDPGS